MFAVHSSLGWYELQKGLAEDGPIRYRIGGCRRLTEDEFLPMALQAARKAGVVRVGQISELIEISYPVMQSIRPNLATHYFAGVNTGSQGKGASEKQAILSSLMENIEMYCLEHREQRVIRGSFDKLSQAHVILDPSSCVTARNCARPTKNEELAWTEAYCPDLGGPILIPAESLYFPFFPKDYATRAIFPQGSNGVAAGTCYLDATIHGLYELIERRFIAQTQTKKGFSISRITSSVGEGFGESPVLARFVASLKARFRVALDMIGVEGLPSIPVFSAIIESPAGVRAQGYGCCLDFDIAVERALSEALQTLATRASGSREDQAGPQTRRENWQWAYGYSPVEWISGKEKRPAAAMDHDYAAKAITENVARAESGAKNFKTLREEFDILRQWIADAGYGPIAISNLTRREIGIPTVKVLVPGLAPLAMHLVAGNKSQENIQHYRFRSAFRETLRDHLSLEGEKFQ